MGYSEIYCHICGVSFNIARRRKPGEPDLASWDYTGKQCDQPGVDEVDVEKCARNGCFAAVSYPEDDDNMSEDPDYVQPDEDLYNHPAEYDSEYESTDCMSTSGEEDANGNFNSTDDNKDPGVDSYSNWLARAFDPHDRFAGEPVGSFGYSDTRCRDEYVFPVQATILSDGHNPEELEHIPSPTCEEANAYSGFAISLEEMKGCRTAQFLVHKSAIPESQDIEFYGRWDASEDWFLSGLRDGMPSRDEHYPEVWPAQGGVDELHAENINFQPEWTNSDDLAMPFHPWCFDIFCRQSKVRFKRINISGLMKWRNAEFSYKDFYSFPRSRDVLEGQDQFWHHVPGKEYLAANPLYVPGLWKILLDTDRNEEDLSRDTMEESHFRSRSCAPLQVAHKDVFAPMPAEIRLLVVSFLDASDIRNLRLASKAFTNLPNSVWRRLVQEDMPWLWEAGHEGEEVHVPSFWTTVTANDLRFFREERERYLTELSVDYTPASKVVDFLLPFPKTIPDPLELPRNTNWHRVYTQIKENWTSLRGLRNRQRIWEDVEEIIRRIEMYETK